MKFLKMMLALALAASVAACATSQGMSVGAVGNSLPKYRHAVEVRSVTGGAMMNVLTQPGVSNGPLKEALETSLRANGYLASGRARYFIDAEIKNLDQPIIGLELDVSAVVTYKVSGAGTSASYPVRSEGKATLADSPIAADRLRIANERAMQDNIRQFLRALR
ncbi:MAG: hypothetical protein WC670_05800 [Pseudolabrys sp.]|jgi:hypothetical protein